MADIDNAPHFGAELKDGFKPASTWVLNGIVWLDDIREFYRERSVIEKEYSAKLNALAKRYFERKIKKSSALSVGETPTVTPGSLESASMTTWTVQLNALEARAAEHERFSVDIMTNLVDPLRHLNTKCEELRKQHVDYAMKLEKERDSSYAELRKSKGKYDGACQEVESRRKKIDSSLDHGKSKAQNAYQQQQSDMYNAKNTYLISINVINKQKERYYNEYIPDLLDSLQDLTESRVAKLNSIWTQAAYLEISTLTRSTDIIKHLSSEIPRNNPILDSMMFLRHNVANWQYPADFVFEPSPVWLDDDAMVTNEAAKTFLRNILSKSKGQLGELRRETDQKRKDLDGMKRIKQGIRAGKDKQDEVEVARATFTVRETLHEVERRKITAEIEVATIVEAVGDVSVGARNHNFKVQTYKIPTNCDLCGERIWGLSAKGFDCRDCGFTCHSKCELKVPADCPGESNKEERKKLKGERTEASHARQPVVEPIRDGKASTPALTRSDTVGSMNTLSSDYAANGNRNVSGGLSFASDETIENTRPAITKARSVPGPRLRAPPPTQYQTGSNGNGFKPGQLKVKVVYSYQKTGQGEISVAEGMEVSILEPDDGSGWVKVRAGYLEGLVPASYLEMLVPGSSLLNIERPSSSYSTSSVSLAGSNTGSVSGMKKIGPAVAPKRGAKKLHYVEAMYEYTARSDAEHSMAEGERFVLINKDAGDGWADVEKNGAVRSVPANYIQDVT